MQLQLSSEGRVGDHTVRITKSLTLEAGSLVDRDRLPARGPAARTSLALRRRVQFRRTCPSAPTTAISTVTTDSASASSAPRLDLADARELGLVDEWLGIDVHLMLSRPTSLWTYPVESVSQSEGGFELVHQSVAVIPHWIIEADADGRWSVNMHLAIDTSQAESRCERSHRGDGRRGDELRATGSRRRHPAPTG